MRLQSLVTSKPISTYLMNYAGTLGEELDDSLMGKISLNRPPRRISLTCRRLDNIVSIVNSSQYPTVRASCQKDFGDNRYINAGARVVFRSIYRLITLLRVGGVGSHVESDR
jgi:hypothetical protein